MTLVSNSVIRVHYLRQMLKTCIYSVQVSGLIGFKHQDNCALSQTVGAPKGKTEGRTSRGRSRPASRRRTRAGWRTATSSRRTSSFTSPTIGAQAPSATERAPRTSLNFRGTNQGSVHEKFRVCFLFPLSSQKISIWVMDISLSLSSSLSSSSVS